MNATLVALLVITVAIVSVSATSPQNCASVTCNPHICRRVECGCGRYSDECGCCDLCYKAPDESCPDRTLVRRSDDSHRLGYAASELRRSDMQSRQLRTRGVRLWNAQGRVRLLRHLLQVPR
ncbi:uncharacterized protein LOC119452938 isoform X6 [Dermacentor silvarum]|uniref:uncharacterized protein LOC119452938 isoform X2 n=1 Tax=Dermacentor silvarum TaxID=543639 RepID=UPI002101AA74|nr:uncharacterized protein LOC119452938 isoform X2 [Dermacentor silvarum]XP_049523365.1 uncharacterized protein LOC119452938 isoform X3 [Dermacentor silvarum]XP_049523366.1 uncharacterized protein LOC119452938 isoform X4 [Dermacentor silvarum]XP_049523367.1 uncharacterized protein LOC119452938 isoform X5 [Dermacentor silvarum]XP_049523368.1 uncharacterized protein LOC119452938 isoform X6 [Dermacentor silvarum]